MKYIGTKMSETVIEQFVCVGIIAVLGTWVCGIINNK